MDLRRRFHAEDVSSNNRDTRTFQFSTERNEKVSEGPFTEQRTIPLISTDVLDVPSQRLLMVAIFVIIQCYKLYDLILLKSGLPVSGILLTSSRFNFITKYFIIDSLFLYFLPNLKIPKLAFKPVTVVLQIVLLTVTTVFLSNEQSFPFVSVLVSAWTKFNTRELSLTGSSVNHRKIMDPSSHFKGALTIKILPENTAVLNPFQDSFCLPMDNVEFETLHIPIRINSSSEIEFMQLEYRNLQNNDVELWNFTRKDLLEVEKGHPLYRREDLISHQKAFGPKIRYFTLPVDRTGLYQIKKIIDSKKLSLRLYKSQVIVPHCPTAVLSGLGNTDRCIGDLDKVSIEVHGVPPLELQYIKTLNADSSTFTDSSLQPEYFESPLLSNSKFFQAQDISDLKWAQNQPVTINLESVLKEDGKYSYAIEKVIDGFGNEVDFSGLPQGLLKTYGLDYTFNVHDLPKATLDTQFNHDSATKRSLMVNFEKTRDWEKASPYTATFQFIDENDEATEFRHEFNQLSTEIPVEVPGTYTLLSVSSKFCSGIVMDKSSVLVTQPIPPSLEIKPTPILDQCVGQTGLNFDLTFTGVPPFYYRVKIFKIEPDERKLYDTKRFTSQGTRNQFTYSPTSEGHYEIVFDELSNTLFTSAIALTPIENYTFKTSMRVKPAASIISNYAEKLCLGGQSKIPLSFNGEPPFSLTYDILETSSNKRTTYTLDDIKSYRYDLDTPVFDVGGDYIVSLISIKDSSGCLVGLSSSDARIEVRRDVPAAQFNLLENMDKMQIKEGTFAELPLRLSGVAPFVVAYQHLSPEGKVLGNYEATFHSSYKAVLKVDKEGKYKLLSVRDQSCSGKIEGIDDFVITFLEKPKFSVLEHNKITRKSDLHFEKAKVCQGFEESIDLALIGSAPFVVSYELISPSGQITSKSIQVATKYASLKFPNDKSGSYVMNIRGAYDSYYTEQDLSRIGYVHDVVSIEQSVNPLPSVQFLQRGKTYRTCSANIGESLEDVEPISLEIKRGSGPFSVSFSVYHESTSKTDYFTIDGITKNGFDSRRLYDGLKLGNHLVTIEKIIDANGCTHDVVSENNHVLISITDVPKISLIDPTIEYCVGDHVAYQLSGVAPFFIKYDFNGIPLKSKEHSSQFIRFASEPGTISVSSIHDSSSQCIVNFTKPGMEKEFEDLSLVIHPIPSVTVSRGDYVVEDIHEGDQAEIIFSFEGTPPFSLTYVRTEEVDDKRGKRRPQIVETHKIEDIYAYEYRAVTSLQGTYEAIEISDAFCYAKNDAYFSSPV